MAYPRCPKCGLVAQIEDECPKCGVYISKYLAVQQRRGVGGERSVAGTAGPGVPALGPVVLPPSMGGPEPSAPSLPPLAKGSTTTTIAIWAAVILVTAGLGYVVFVDWFGAVYSFRPPPGWKSVSNDALEKAVGSMSSAGQADKEFHALYTPDGSTVAQSAIAVVELEQEIPMTEEAAATLRAGFARLQAQPLLGRTTATAELTKVGGRPAIEMRFDINMAGVAASMIQDVVGAGRSTFVVLYFAPAAEFSRDGDAVRTALASFRVVRAEGLRNHPWVKYPLRWGWILGVLLLAFVGYGRIRNRE